MRTNSAGSSTRRAARAAHARSSRRIRTSRKSCRAPMKVRRRALSGPLPLRSSDGRTHRARWSGVAAWIAASSVPKKNSRAIGSGSKSSRIRSRSTPISRSRDTASSARSCECARLNVVRASSRGGSRKGRFSRSTVDERDRTRVDAAIPAEQVAQHAVRDDPARSDRGGGRSGRPASSHRPRGVASTLRRSHPIATSVNAQTWTSAGPIAIGSMRGAGSMRANGSMDRL